MTEDQIQAQASYEAAMAQFSAGQTGIAKTLFEKAIQANPHHSMALHKLGLIAYQTGNNARAIQLMREAIAANPDNVSAYSDLGGMLNLENKLDEAIFCFEQAISRQPSDIQAHYNLGCTLQSQGKLQEAEASYRNALTINPDAIEILCNLGSCLQEQAKAEEAISCYRQALALNPNDIKSINNLGVSLQNNGKKEEAIACFERTIAEHPDYARAYINLGMTYYDDGDLDKAFNYYQQAVAIDPNDDQAHFSVGVALQTMCKPEEALDHYRRAVSLKPMQPKNHENILMCMQFIPSTTLDELFAAHRTFGEHFERDLKPHWKPHTNARDPHKRLKIGYVSGDFRMHAVSYFIEPVFTHHDASQVEIFCYSNSAKRDAFTDRLIASVEHWQPCLSMPDDQLAARIRADEIDILVDLAGHTAHNRLLTFARKPAPIQMTYLGYPGTTGLTAIDYRLTDNFTEPGNDQYYTEKLLRLPDSMWCYRPSENMSDVTPLPALTNGYLTFGSFNNINKVGEECIKLWAALLRTLPTARLMIVTVTSVSIQERLTSQFAELGVTPERLTFYGKLPTRQFQNLMQQVDITLDPFPVNGATTTCESLWLGVPTMAMVGERFLARAGLSVLSAAQLPDFAAETQEKFLQTATLLANNIPLLASIRMGLRDHLKTTPLFDQQRFTRNLENLYRQVWTTWCHANP